MIDAAPVLFHARITLLINLGVKAMFFEFCVYDGQAPVRPAMLSNDSSCFNSIMTPGNDSQIFISHLLVFHRRGL